MISFDDYGGGDGGSVNLSPIYNSLSTINEYISTLSNDIVNNYYYTTLSYDSIVNSGTIITVSRPYLQDFTPSDGTYQYNISGDVDVSDLSFSNDFNILGAISNVSGTINVADTIDLKIDKFENFSEAEIANTIQYLKLSGKNLINNTFSSILRGEINVDKIESMSFNVDDINISGISLTSNTFSNTGIVNLNVNTISENVFSSNDFVLNGNIIRGNTYSGSNMFITGKDVMYNDIKTALAYYESDVYNFANKYTGIRHLDVSGFAFSVNTLSNVNVCNLNVEQISKNQMSTVRFLFLSNDYLYSNTFSYAYNFHINGNYLSSNYFKNNFRNSFGIFTFDSNTWDYAEDVAIEAYVGRSNTFNSIRDLSFKVLTLSSISMKGDSLTNRKMNVDVWNAGSYVQNTITRFGTIKIEADSLSGNLIKTGDIVHLEANTLQNDTVEGVNYLSFLASNVWNGNVYQNIGTVYGHVNTLEAKYSYLKNISIEGREARHLSIYRVEDAKVNFYNYASDILYSNITHLYLNYYFTKSDITYTDITRYIVGFAGTSNYLFDSNWNYTLDSSILDTNKLYLSEVPYALLTKGGSGGGSPYMKSYNSTDGVYQYNITGTYDIWNLRQLQTLTLNGHLNITHDNLDTLTFKYFNVDLEGYNSGWWLESMKQMKINNGDNFVFNTLRNGDFVNVYGGIQSKNSFSGIHYLNQAVSSNKQNTYLENRIYKCCIPFEFIKNSISNNSINDITLVSPYTISSDWNSGNTFNHNGLNHIVAGGLYKNTFSDNQFDDIDVMTLNGNEFNDDDYISLKAYSMNGNAFTLIEGFNHLEGIFAHNNTFKYAEMCDIKYYSMNANSFDSCYDMSISAVIDSSNTYSNITKLNLNGYMLDEPVFSDISTLKLTAESLTNGTIKNINRFHVNKSELINNFRYTYGINNMYLEYPDGIFDSYGKIETSNTLTSIMYLDNVPLTYLKQLENGGGGVFNYMKPYYSSDGNYQYNLSGKPTTTFELSDNIKYDLYGNWSINQCSFTSFNNNINISCHEFNSNSGDSFDGLTINSPFITENQISQINSLNVNGGIFSSNLMTTINYFDYDGPLLQKNTFQAGMFSAKNCNVKDNIIGCNNMYLNDIKISNNNFNGYKEFIIDANLIMKNTILGEYIVGGFNNGYLSIRCNDDIKTNQIAQWNLADINVQKYKLSDCKIFGNDTVNITAGGIINSGTTTYSGIKELNISASGTISNAIFENIDKLCISAGALSNCTFRSLKTCDLFEISEINTNNCDFSSIRSLKYPLLHSNSISIDMYNGTQGTLAGDSIISIDFKNVDYNLVDWIKRSTYTYFNESNYFYGAASDCYWNGVNMMVFK